MLVRVDCALPLVLLYVGSKGDVEATEIGGDARRRPDIEAV